MDNEIWRWLWTVFAIAMGIGEIFTAGFFLLPFAIGATAAAVLAWTGVSLLAQWLVFFGVSLIAIVYLRRFIRRQDDPLRRRSVPIAGPTPAASCSRRSIRSALRAWSASGARSGGRRPIRGFPPGARCLCGKSPGLGWSSRRSSLESNQDQGKETSVMDNSALVLLFVVVAFALILVAATGFRVVRPFERGLVEFLGRYEKTVESGLRWVMPFVKRLAKVDMREQVVDVPPQEVITKDNVVVTVDAVIYFEATDPVKLKYNVQTSHWR